jgi:AAA family ATP:ADP antiporter
MRKANQSDPSIHAAALSAAALIAHQVGGKATRDALFLSHFDIAGLPWMVVAASILAIATGIAGARLMSSTPPARVIPRAFVGSAALLIAEWGLSYWNHALVAVLVYLQIAALGTALISGFWSLLGDRFNPHTARKQFTRVVAAGTFGGMVGGLLAERVGTAFGVTSMLPVLAALDLISAFLTSSLSRPKRGAAFKPRHAQAPRFSTLATLQKEPYLRNLALLLVMTTISAGLLDYVFKARAVAAHQNGTDLVRFFAIFYTSIGVVTFLVQIGISRFALEKLGLPRTVGSLPFATAFAGVAGLAFPGLASATLGRGGESILRSSLFRSGYELFFAAAPPHQRHQIKPILDIGFDRLGDILGGMLISIMLFAGAAAALPLMLLTAAGIGIAGVWISKRLHAGYVKALENNLLNQSIHIDISDIRDSTTRAAVMQTLTDRQSLDRKQTVILPVSETRVVQDPVVNRVAALRSRDAVAVKAALRDSLDPMLAGHVISLLAWNVVADDAVQALQRIASPITGQLVDALLDPAQEFAVRRRIPRVLSVTDSQRAFDGLTQALFDSRFEVRFQSGRALAQIQDRAPDVKVDQGQIIRAILDDLAVDKEIWKNRSVIDGSENEHPSVSAEHIFRILSLILPREPLKIAYRGLHSSDEHLKGMALEYLDSVLPEQVRRMISPILEAA